MNCTYAEAFVLGTKIIMIYSSVFFFICLIVLHYYYMEKL